MKTWFITGASRGFGHAWATAALARGDRVAATARSPQALTDLTEAYGDRVLALALDVTDRSAVFAAVSRAAERSGSLDVVVNNAGYGLFGIVEAGPYGTDWSGASAVHTEPIAAYEPVREARRAGSAARGPADPALTAQVILKLVDSEEPPLRLFVGPYPYAVAEKTYHDRLETWRDRRWLAEQAVPGSKGGKA
jgi:NAD(P)-dependent dehydrogenase (short-subunit alcohol dehydrogenase family)